MRMAPSRVIVTGAAQGIGRAVALRAGGDAARASRSGTRRPTAPRRPRACAGRRGAMARAWRVDVGAADRGRGRGRGGRAGMGRAGRPRQQCRHFSRARGRSTWSLPEWEQVLRVNLTGTFLCARAVAAPDEGGRPAAPSSTWRRAGRSPAPPTARIIPRPRAASSR